VLGVFGGLWYPLRLSFGKVGRIVCMIALYISAKQIIAGKLRA